MSRQAQLFDDMPFLPQKAGTYQDNKNLPIHRWFPFVEGYGAALVERSLVGHTEGVIFDPFGGSGTTSLAASSQGHDSVFCEINPFMRWLADVKINQARSVWKNGTGCGLREFAESADSWTNKESQSDHPLLRINSKREFFPHSTASQIVHALGQAEHLPAELRLLCRAAVAAVLIPSSNMIRRPDLGRRKDGKGRQEFIPLLKQKLVHMADDINAVGEYLTGTAEHIGNDARQFQWGQEPCKLIITSPPYLNGTSYIRNSKLELLTLGFIDSEDDLGNLRKDAIAAGINNISKRRTAQPVASASVEDLASRLEDTECDRRIPEMVRMYFSDMNDVCKAVRSAAAPQAKWHIDIGDSKWAGIHIPTHEILADLAEHNSWRLSTTETLRVRRSYDGGKLTQVLMTLEAV